MHFSVEKDVTGEQGQRNLLGAVLPAMKSGVEGEEDFKSLTRKNAGDGFLMLVPRVERIPSGFGGVGRFHRIAGSAERSRPRTSRATPLGGPGRPTSTLCLRLKLGLFLTLTRVGVEPSTGSEARLALFFGHF